MTLGEWFVLILALAAVLDIWRERRQERIDLACTMDRVLSGTTRKTRPGDTEGENFWRQQRSGYVRSEHRKAS